MGKLKRVFILGAGFSKPAKMPLATELLPPLLDKLKLDEMREWVGGLCERVAWLSGSDQQTESLALNIEQVFHNAHFNVEAFRFQDPLVTAGLGDGEHWWGND